jgi:hypothetical protein
MRQVDAIRVLPFPFVLLGKNLFQPVRLPLRDFLVHEGGVMKHDELLAATVTAKSSHFLECWHQTPFGCIQSASKRKIPSGKEVPNVRCKDGVASYF